MSCVPFSSRVLVIAKKKSFAKKNVQKSKTIETHASFMIGDDDD